MTALRSRVLHGSGLSVIVLALQSPAIADTPAIDSNLARRYFEEARAISEKDDGRMWGIRIYGPMLFVEPQSRAVVANQADHKGYLKEKDGVFVGTLPPGAPMANTAVPWAGVEWTMMIWPPPEDKNDRRCLIAHELWHRIQGKLGLFGTGFGNHHLNTRDGRIYLQLEWRALVAALRRSDDGRRRAVEDALTFRAYRRRLFASASAEERPLEMHEGLAEYTGIRLSTDSDEAAAVRAVKNLRKAEGYDTFVRSFAYASGPAYGLLLDHANPDWCKTLRADDDLGLLLRKTLSIPLPEDLEAEAKTRALEYDAERLTAAEDQRESAGRKRIAQYRKRFVADPVLVIPLHSMQIQFDPRSLQPLGDLGTVYPTVTISDVWGILKVTGGALVSEPGRRSIAIVPAPEDPSARPLNGNGWALELKEGWTVRAGKREGDFVVEKVSNNG